MKEGDLVQYTGIHSVLKTGETYKVRSVGDTHIQVYSNTGFVGTNIGDFILVQVSE